jgi:type IV pilus assembly protein PilA
MRIRRLNARPPRRQAGLTIIELMTVLAILGVLLLIAITSYGTYTKRTLMMEVMLAAGVCKPAVFEAYYYGTVPASGNWGCENNTTKYVQSIAVDDNGKISVIVSGFNDADIDGGTLTLTPIVDGVPATLATGQGKNLLWRCGESADGTTIPTRFLPFSCRGSP